MLHLLRQSDTHREPLKTTRPELDAFLPPCVDACFASTGRSLVRLLVERLGLTAEDTCLIPAYVPEGLIRPLRESGIRVEFYTVSDRLFADLDALKIQVDNAPSIRLFVLIHPFGFEQPVQPVRDLFSGRDIAILEDCAQSLFGRSASGPLLGGEGDFSLFSLNKFLPVADCAILQSHRADVSVAEDRFAVDLPEREKSLAAYEDHLRLNHELLLATPETAGDILTATGDAYERYYAFVNTNLDLFPPCEATLKRLQAIDFEGLVEARIANTRLLYERLEQNVFRFVNPQWSDNCVPMTVPVAVDAEKRDMIVSALLEKNILLSTLVDKWDYVPADRADQFRAETRFIQSHLLVPVSEFISQEQMAEMIDAMNAV